MTDETKFSSLESDDDSELECTSTGALIGEYIGDAASSNTSTSGTAGAIDGLGLGVVGTPTGVEVELEAAMSAKIDLQSKVS
eukprot:1432349-Amphidinium_carterae.1